MEGIQAVPRSVADREDMALVAKERGPVPEHQPAYGLVGFMGWYLAEARLMLHLKAAAIFIAFVGLMAGAVYGMAKYPDTAYPIIGGLWVIGALVLLYGVAYSFVKDHD